ncbi:MAG: dipeptidase [Rhizobiaceae bacterium]|nr:dipeptidase [Rhizobiaceae bacterium]
MTNNQLPLIFDGHNDILLRLYKMGEKHVHRKFLNGDNKGHLDLPRMRKGGFGGGFFAIYIPSDLSLEELIAEMSKPRYDVALPAEIPFKEALPVAVKQAAILARIERESEGAVKICHNARQIRQCLNTGVLAVIMHIEGAEAIGEDFSGLDVLYNAGLRSIGPVWSRPTRFGHGVPFRFPSSPDTGPGLSDLGKELITLCNHYKIVVDLAHLNEAGFWDVAKNSDAPLIATHSNAHAICPHSRNLTDKQLAAIRESGGIVGLNFATSAVRTDGQSTPETTIEEMLRHFDYLIEHLGIDGVAIGSDFDGATISNEIKDVAGLPNLRQAMRAHGYDEDMMVKLCHENWLNVLERTFGS